jgi:hypothetical protein
MARCEKQEARSKKQEARSKKQEARSEKREARSEKGTAPPKRLLVTIPILLLKNFLLFTFEF